MKFVEESDKRWIDESPVSSKVNGIKRSPVVIDWVCPLPQRAKGKPTPT